MEESRRIVEISDMKQQSERWKVKCLYFYNIDRFAKRDFRFVYFQSPL